jgi:uncharacterized protein YcgI (DUF1989 family)
MTEHKIVPAASAVGLRLKAGQRLRIVDTEGGQTGDLVAYSPDGQERLSSGRTFDYGGKIYVSTGDQLWSDRSNPMLTILADDVGRHDMLYAACTLEMYRMQYGAAGDNHPNCHDNLSAALRGLGVDPVFLPQTLNFFMHADVDPAGRLSIVAPRTWAGAALVLRAEMDLAIAISACPATGCNGGAPPRPLGYEILSD